MNTLTFWQILFFLPSLIFSLLTWFFIFILLSIFPPGVYEGGMQVLLPSFAFIISALLSIILAIFATKWSSPQHRLIFKIIVALTLAPILLLGLLVIVAGLVLLVQGK